MKMRIIITLKSLFEHFLEDKVTRYALKHRVESGLLFTNPVTLDHFRNGELIHTQTGPNIFTTEGMARMLNVQFRAQTTDAAIYCGIFKNSVTPALANTAATCLGAAGTYGECQDADYDDPLTNRPAYTMAATTTAVATNAASKATFVIAASFTVYGAFLASSQAKTATTGTLFCAKTFASSRAVIADDELAVTYQLTLTTS
jgi:hypothetical protein